MKIEMDSAVVLNILWGYLPPAGHQANYRLLNLS